MTVVFKKRNPFMLKAKQREMTEAGIEIGTTVRVWWKVDEAYGGQTREHQGEVERFDDMLYITGSSRSPGHLMIGILGVTNYEVVDAH